MSKYDSWHTLSASIAYNLDSMGIIKIGATNLTDEDPLLDETGRWRMSTNIRSQVGWFMWTTHWNFNSMS